MFTLLKAKGSFDKAWRQLKKKDEIAIKKVERRFRSKDRFSNNFTNKVYDIYDAYKLRVPYIATVLKEYIDNPVYEAWFGFTFSEARVCSVLYDMQFVAMLMCNSLIRRAANLDRKSKNQLKLRLYIAIINYDKYKKAKILATLGKAKKNMIQLGRKK